MLGVDLSTLRTGYNDAVAVTSIADACFREIETIQQHGPYRLAGSSFGGLVAIEVARLLQSAGQSVGLLALIDTVFDHSNWPRGLFLILQARRAYWHVQRIRRLPARDAIREFNHRLRQLRLRLRTRHDPLALSENLLSKAS